MRPLATGIRSFGQDYANRLRRRWPQLGDLWHRHEVLLSSEGKRHCLGRAVDQDDNVFDILVRRRWNKKAAKTCFRKLRKGLKCVPRLVMTDQLKSDGAAQREILPGVEHQQNRYFNHRCEDSHRPTRQWEWRTHGFKSPVHAQGFLSAYGPMPQHFRLRWHPLSASVYRQEMGNRFAGWAEMTGTKRAD